jgi:hypothetical protein
MESTGLYGMLGNLHGCGGGRCAQEHRALQQEPTGEQHQSNELCTGRRTIADVLRHAEQGCDVNGSKGLCSILEPIDILGRVVIHCECGNIVQQLKHLFTLTCKHTTKRDLGSRRQP